MPKSVLFIMEQYDEYYWLDSEVPEEHVEAMFDWMFEKANEIYSEKDQEEIGLILRSN